MREYTPDLWCVVEVTSDNATFCKIFACWYGGFTGSDSWKLSSGIESVKDVGEYLEFPQSSGSVYVCHKNSYGMSGYGSAVFAQLQQQLPGLLRMMSEEEAKAYHV